MTYKNYMLNATVDLMFNFPLFVCLIYSKGIVYIKVMNIYSKHGGAKKMLGNRSDDLSYIQKLVKSNH